MRADGRRPGRCAAIWLWHGWWRLCQIAAAQVQAGFDHDRPRRRAVTAKESGLGAEKFAVEQVVAQRRVVDAAGAVVVVQGENAQLAGLRDHGDTCGRRCHLAVEIWQFSE